MPKTSPFGPAPITRPSSDPKQHPAKGGNRSSSQRGWNQGGETPERPKPSDKVKAPGGKY